MSSRLALIIAGGVTFVAMCIGACLFFLTGALVDTATVKAMDNPETWEKTTSDAKTAAEGAPTDLTKQRTLLYVYLKSARPEAAFLVFNEHIKQPSPKLFDMLDTDKDPQVRSQALLLYDYIQTTEGIDPQIVTDITARILKGASDPEESVKQSAVKALQRTNSEDPAIDKALTSIVTGSKEYLTRFYGTNALAARLDLAKSKPADERRARSLAIMEPLVPVIDDSDQMIAKEAGQLVVRIAREQGPASRDILVKAAQNWRTVSGKVGMKELFMQIEGGDSDAYKALEPTLLQLLDSKGADDRRFTLGIYSLMNQPKLPKMAAIFKPALDKAYPTVKPLLGSASAEDRAFALQILAAVRRTQFAPEALPFLDDTDPLVRWAAVQAVASCKLADSVPRLRKMAADTTEEEQVRETAGRAVAFLTESDKPQGDGSAATPSSPGTSGKSSGAAATPAKTSTQKKKQSR
ncbi:hypothetical protein DB346_18425 [Verrucomicrobia bacterium LW23]|nr:hypothetical protein DB346_18425 [Verrucomicrobia bacterium LW23]